MKLLFSDVNHFQQLLWKKWWKSRALHRYVNDKQRRRMQPFASIARPDADAFGCNCPWPSLWPLFSSTFGSGDRIVSGSSSALILLTWLYTTSLFDCLSCLFRRRSSRCFFRVFLLSERGCDGLSVWSKYPSMIMCFIVLEPVSCTPSVSGYCLSVNGSIISGLYSLALEVALGVVVVSSAVVVGVVTVGVVVVVVSGWKFTPWMIGSCNSGRMMVSLHFTEKRIRKFFEKHANFIFSTSDDDTLHFTGSLHNKQLYIKCLKIHTYERSMYTCNLLAKKLLRCPVSPSG